MSVITSVSGIHETATVEELIRYACRRFEQRGIPFPPARMSKLIRKAVRTVNSYAARRAIDSYLADQENVDSFSADRDNDRSWAGFELYVNGYADPTGERAAVNVDNQRLAARTGAGRVMPHANR